MNFILKLSGNNRFASCAIQVMPLATNTTHLPIAS